MMMASCQTFFGQINHLSSLVKFGQTNCYIYIISKEVIEFAKTNEYVHTIFTPYHKHYYKTLIHMPGILTVN